jgi:hypothetical protein
VPDIITGAGPGGAAHVKVIDGTKLGQVDASGQIAASALYASFFVFEPAYTGGVYVGAGNIDGDRFTDVVATAFQSGGPRVSVFRGSDLSQLANFFAYEDTLRTGNRLVLADIDADTLDELVMAAGPGGASRVIKLDPLTGEVIDNRFVFGDQSRTGFNVG